VNGTFSGSSKVESELNWSIVPEILG
jgi:hypothetical protein